MESSTVRPRIAVVGAGAVGLSTAVQIQGALPDARVTLISEKFNRDTTSDGAAGVFIADVHMLEEIPSQLARMWFSDSFEYYKKLLVSPEAKEAGISHIVGYRFFVDDLYHHDPAAESIYFDSRPCTRQELSLFPVLAGKANHAEFISTVTIEGRWFLPYLLKKFHEQGGVVEQRKVQSLKELVGHYDVVANCTGIGSNELLGNKEVVPVRGQVIRVKAPWIKYFTFVDGYQSYIIPGIETCVIGGTRQYGNGNLELCKEDTEKMWKDVCNYVPSISKAEWQWQWVGLRPYRKPLRLEKETMKFNEGILEVVHNYGHAGNGMSLCWGTGKYATRLVVETIAEKFNHSKL